MLATESSCGRPHVNFNNKSKAEEFPLDLYIDLLKYLKDKYNGDFWHALPKDVAKFVFNQSNAALSHSQSSLSAK